MKKNKVKMKKSKLSIFCCVIILFFISTACYEPVSNTSASNENENMGTETPQDNENHNKPVNKSINVEENKNSNSNQMNETNSETTTKVKGFRNNLDQNLSKHGLSFSQIIDETNAVELRILDDYGAVFLTKATPPNKTMFTSDEEVNAFQSKAGVSGGNLNGIKVELQAEALKALVAADEEAKKQGLRVTPNDPKDSARRSYQHTHKLWNGRFEKALGHWKKKGKLKDAQISRLKSLPIKEQVKEVLELEKKGIYFSTYFDKSILYSVAAPGTSQHISMLAFDAKEWQNKKVRAILAKHGWFRTVKSDAPHFTYLGYKESELKDLGLKKVTNNDGEFWIPNV